MEDPCRLCLQHNSVNIDVFDIKDGVEIAQMVRTICSIFIAKRDFHFICEICFDIISRAYELRSLSIANNEYWQQYASSGQRPVKIEQDEIIKYEPSPSVLNHVSDEEDDANYDVIEVAIHPDDASDAFSCDHCSEVKQMKEEMELHVREKHSSENNCSLCGKQFSSPGILKQHLKRKHMTEECLSCDHCKMVFKTSRRLEKHQDIHEYFVETVDKELQTIFSCRYCAKEYKEMSERMHDHIYQHKKKEDTAQEQRRTTAKRTKDEDESLVCPHCGQIYRTKQILQQHIKRHFDTGDKHACPKCPQKFKSWGELYYHSVVHTTERNFICEICSKAFKAKRDLRNHKIRHDMKDVKKFQCTYCQLMLKSKYTLSRHILIHTGEKKHACQYCQKSFTQKNELNKHLRIHVGEKTYKCEEPDCSEAFRLLAELRLHQSEHYQKTCDGSVPNESLPEN